MKNLIEQIAAYENCVQGLLDKIEEYTDFVQKNVPKEFWADLKVRDFGNSQFEWICAYHYDGEKRKVIPSVTKKCGGSQYAYNDFNCLREFATRKEVVVFAKNLPTLIKKAEEKIASLLADAQAIS